MGTFKWLKLLPLIRFLSFNRASECFRLTNLTIALLSCPLLFLESESLWQYSISFKCVFKIFIRNAVWYSWYFHVVSAAILLLLLLIFFKILSSKLRLTSPTISISLWRFLLSATIWFTLSVSLSIFLQSSCRSASMTTFPLRSRIFWTNSDFFNEFNVDFDKFKIFLLLSPVLYNPLKCQRREMKILKFSW